MALNCSMSDIEYQTPSDATSAADGASSMVIGRLEQLLTKIVTLEFFLIASACYLASVIYNEAFLSRWPPTDQYIPAALFIAFLVLIASLGFKHCLGGQTQSRDRFMWNGLGAIVLAFSLFLSLLFVFKISDWYSRGTFFFQFFAAIAATVIVRGLVHAHIRHGIQTGMVKARRAVLIGEDRSNVEVLENLRRSGFRTVGKLPFPYIHGNTVPGVVAFPQNARQLVERCRSFRPDDVIFLATPNDLPRISYVADALSELAVAVHIIPIGASDFWASFKVANFGGWQRAKLLSYASCGDTRIAQ
jgi:hypothetical protein